MVFEALTNPSTSGGREWLKLEANEVTPEILEAREHDLVLWSSLWPPRPDARIQFEISDVPAYGDTMLCWRLFVETPIPDDSHLGYLRKRLQELINRDLRAAFGQ